VSPIEPELNALYQQQVGHGEKRNRAQQRHCGFRFPKLAVILRGQELVTNGEVRANAYLLPFALGLT